MIVTNGRIKWVIICKMNPPHLGIYHGHNINARSNGGRLPLLMDDSWVIPATTIPTPNIYLAHTMRAECYRLPL